MGLMIHSLGELPIEATRGYYVYILDYGWEEPLSEALRSNFRKMADLASHSNAAVIRGTVGSHFEDEVLSWHHVNGQDAKEILPAILVTTRHPQDFQLGLVRETHGNNAADWPMLLIPLRDICKTATDVTSVIEKLFQDIKTKKELSTFQIKEKLTRGKGRAFVDALILQPNFNGMGMDLKVLKKLFDGVRGKH